MNALKILHECSFALKPYTGSLLRLNNNIKKTQIEASLRSECDLKAFNASLQLLYCFFTAAVLRKTQIEESLPSECELETLYPLFLALLRALIELK